MNTVKKWFLLNSGGGASIPWWLAGGLIPESTDYTIYDPASAASEAESFINLANPGTRDAIKYGTVTFTSGVGWKGNGTNGYFDTQRTLHSSMTVIAMFRDPTSGRFIFGALQASPNRTASINPYSSTNVAWYVSQSFTSSASRHLGGTVGITMAKAYRNGIRDNTLNFTWSGGTTTRTLKLLCYDDGTPQLFNGAYLHRVAVYNFTLSDAQMLAVSDYMLKIGESALNPYSSRVMALSPSAYYPLNIKSGYMFTKDYSGNNIVSTYFGGWVGGAIGQYGNAVTCDGIANSQILPNLNTGYPNLRDFDLDECSVSMWINLTYTAPLNQKILEIWRTGLNEYIAFEVRETNQFGAFWKTNGTTESNSSMFVGGSGWHHLVMYNSVSEGVIGMYYDGVKYELTNSLGATITRTNQLFEFGVIDGSIQHIAVYDRLLTQEEVNSLIP